MIKCTTREIILLAFDFGCSHAASMFGIVIREKEMIL